MTVRVEACWVAPAYKKELPVGAAWMEMFNESPASSTGDCGYGLVRVL